MWLEPGSKTRGSMGRVPALRAESIFYWIRQEKRKRRDALAKLESKIIYFCTEAKMNVKVEDEDHANLPPLPINEMRVEKEDEKDADWDEELTHWYNNENNIHEDNFQPQSGDCLAYLTDFTQGNIYCIEAPKTRPCA